MNRLVQNQVKQHNDIYRNVKHKNSYSTDRFLAESLGNLLINGGTKEQRLQVLKKAITQANQLYNAPVIVFGSDSMLQNSLIELAHSGQINRLYVCSSKYRNYDFFSGMNSNQILDYFFGIALEKGFRDTSELEAYAGAFLNVLKTQAPVNLASIVAFSNNSDTDIASLAREHSIVDYETIISSIKSGISFRRLVAMTVNAFEGICNLDNSTGLNISAVAEQPCVMYIQIPPLNFELFSHYYLQAFKQLIYKHITFVFDDCIMLNNKEFSDTLEIVKQRSNINMITACENIMAFSGDGKLNNYSRHIVFLNNPAVSLTDTQRVLDSLGEYTNYDATRGTNNTPHLLFSFLKSNSTNITMYNRSKVLLEQEQGNETVLRGHNGSEIMVVKHLS